MNNQLLPEPKLRAKAQTDCANLLKTFYNQSLSTDLMRSEIEWNNLELRHMYAFEAQLWLSGSKFDVVVDEKNRPVGYVDWAKWDRCSWKPFARDRIVPLASETGFVPANALLIGYGQGIKGCLQARLLTNPAQASSPRYVVRINPITGRIISIFPEGINL